MKNYVKLLAVLHILVAGLVALLGFVVLNVFRMIGAIDFSRATSTMATISDLRAEGQFAQAAFGLVGSALLLFSLANFITGLGLFQFRQWARTVGIGLSIFDLVLVPLGTLFGIYSLCVLLPKATRRLFSPIADGAPET
jgi:hypothetical protein